MRDDIFRKKSLERVASPESLDEYIRVSSPAAWLLLAGLILLLVGACVFGIFGRIETHADAKLFVSGGSAVCACDDASVAEGQILRVEGVEATLGAQSVDTETGKVSYVVTGLTLADGVYDCVIVTESVAPFFFVFN